MEIRVGELGPKNGYLKVGQDGRELRLRAGYVLDERDEVAFNTELSRVDALALSEALRVAAKVQGVPPKGGT